MAEADWDAAENALIAWVQRTSGFPPNRVIWDQQNGPRPARPFATLRRDGGTTAGLVDEQAVIYNGDDAPPGEEITLDTKAHAEFTLTVTFFTAETVGNSSAVRVANRVRNSLSTERTLNYFDAAQLALIDRAPVLNLTDLLDTEIEGQAAFDVRLRIADGTEELTTYVETASMSGTVE